MMTPGRADQIIFIFPQSSSIMPEIHGHEYLHEIAETMRRAGFEVDVHHHEPGSGERFAGIVPKHDYHLIFSTTEHRVHPDAGHVGYIPDSITHTPHRVTMSPQAYSTFLNILRQKYGKDLPELLEYVKKNTLRAEYVSRGKNVSIVHVGLPFVVRDERGKLSIIDPHHDVTYGEHPALSELLRRPEHPSSRGVKYVFQGEYGLSDSKHPVVATGKLGPCVAVFVHDEITGRSAVVHVDDASHFAKWKELVERMHRESPGRFKVWIVGSMLHQPFVRRQGDFRTAARGQVAPDLVKAVAEHVRDLRSKGIDVQEPRFVHALNAALDSRNGKLFAFNTSVDALERKVLELEPHRREHIREVFERSGRTTMHEI